VSLISIGFCNQTYYLARGTVRDYFSSKLNIILSCCVATNIYSYREENSELRVALDAIDDQNRRLDMNRTRELQSLKEEVLGAVMQLKQETSLQNLTIRKHFDALQSLKTDRITGVSGTVKDEFRYHNDRSEANVQKLSSNMKLLASVATKLARETKMIASEQWLLRGLSYDGMKSRHENVKDSHTDSFAWIFNRDTNQEGEERPPHQFPEWLERKSGTYWIRGKPGSGKSTLMKYLCRHSQTVQMLRIWAGNAQLVTASFFFWTNGSMLQRSQEGLLRSILYELLRQAPELIPKVCSKYSESIPWQNEPEPWTRNELLDCLTRIGTHGTVSKRFCLFIDDLDEYHAPEEGGFRELVSLLHGIGSSPDIKLCVASRPENDFVDAFKRDNLYLRVEEMTRNDIRKYVDANFNSNAHFAKYLSRDPQCQRLIESIVTQANGVFLWVALAVRSLLQSMTNSDRIVDLEARLKHIPPTLEEYFQQMLDSVESHYLEETAKLIQIALEASGPLRLMTYWLLDGEDVTSLKEEDCEHIEDAIRRRLQARCKGLLEVTYYHDPDIDAAPSYCRIWYAKVSFMHRTVSDYLRSPNMQQLFRDRLPKEFDPRLMLCAGFLLQLKALQLHFKQLGITLGIEIFQEALESMMLYGHRIERDTLQSATSLYEILDDGETVCRSLPSYSSYAEDSPYYRKKASVVGLSVERGLGQYVSYRLNKNPKLVQDSSEELLARALRPTPPGMTDPKMVHLLLENGADPNALRRVPKQAQEGFEKISIWCWFLVEVYNRAVVTEHPIALYDVLKALISNGASLSQKVKVKTNHVNWRSTGRAADLYKQDKYIPVIEEARYIIQNAIPPEEFAQLSKAGSKKSRFLIFR
jgi:NACHT domain-containing protein